MIEDFNNCRMVHFGRGTVGIGIDITDMSYIMCEKSQEPVGDDTEFLKGKNACEIDEKTVCLLFAENIQ